MERLDLWFKGALTAVGALFSLLADNFGVLFAVLVIVMIADFITGIIASVREGRKLRSAIGIAGFSKKVVTLIIIGLVYLIELTLFNTNTAGDAIAMVYVGLEFLSITENAARIGVYVHPRVLQLIDVLKGEDTKTGGKGET